MSAAARMRVDSFTRRSSNAMMLDYSTIWRFGYAETPYGVVGINVYVDRDETYFAVCHDSRTYRIAVYRVVESRRSLAMMAGKFARRIVAEGWRP